MAPASIPAGVLHKPTLLLLLLLLPELLWAARTDTHSFSLHFTIKPKAPYGEQWCSIQGDIDKKPVFSYDCSSAIPKATNIMGEEVNSTETWEQLRETSKHVGEQLREKLLDTKPQNCGTTAPLTLSANMTCQLVAGGHRSWCWDFDINGQTSAQVDSRRKMWTEEPSGRSCMKDNWEKDREMTSILYRTSEGDCQKWREELLKYLKRQEEPTAPPPTTQNLPPSSSVEITPNVWVLLLIITCYILCCFYGEIQ